ncbi:MAG: RNA polymerase sigma factor [Candidatus Pacebacteria bacterium]|nr:RNA polymerase sigma factor [Candidatus Paceibacterota bacterium]MCF7856884.1 RNA polymerase sigma factor [Candidatus Paceibacterota bacterium]
MFGLTTGDNIKNLTDEEILARVQVEPWLFTAILERYQAAFLRKSKSIIFNEQDAEEVVQDAFTKIYINAHKFEVREGAKFSSWAYTILVNTALTRYQKCVKEGKRTLLLDPEYMELIGDIREHSGFDHDKDAIERILVNLPGHFARVLRLHYLEHWSHKDIANESGESVGAIKARIHRAKAEFRKEAKNQGV